MIDFIGEHLCIVINYTRCDVKLEFMIIWQEIRSNSKILWTLHKQISELHHHHKKCKLSSKNYLTPNNKPKEINLLLLARDSNVNMFRLQLCIWHNEGIKQECNETHVSRITSELQLIKIQKIDYKWNKIKYKFCASLDLSPAVWRFRVWEVLAISTSIACFSTSSCSILILLQALSSLGTALWLRNFTWEIFLCLFMSYSDIKCHTIVFFLPFPLHKIMSKVLRNF